MPSSLKTWHPMAAHVGLRKKMKANFCNFFFFFFCAAIVNKILFLLENDVLVRPEQKSLTGISVQEKEKQCPGDISFLLLTFTFPHFLHMSCRSADGARNETIRLFLVQNRGELPRPIFVIHSPRHQHRPDGVSHNLFIPNMTIVWFSRPCTSE